MSLAERMLIALCTVVVVLIATVHYRWDALPAIVAAYVAAYVVILFGGWRYRK